MTEVVGGVEVLGVSIARASVVELGQVLLEVVLTGDADERRDIVQQRVAAPETTSQRQPEFRRCSYTREGSRRFAGCIHATHGEAFDFEREWSRTRVPANQGTLFDARVGPFGRIVQRPQFGAEVELAEAPERLAKP